MPLLDYTTLKKFEDLDEKAKRIHATQQISDIAAVVDATKFQEWATSALSLLQKLYGETSPHYLNFNAIYSKIISIPYKESFDNCRAILQGAREEYEGGGNFQLKDYLERAVLEYLAARSSELLNAGEKEAACVLATVLLESALKQLCVMKGTPEGSIEQMNDALCKAGAYQVGMRQRIMDWRCMKDDMVHGHGDKYRSTDVEEMLRVVQRFIGKELS